MTEEAAKLLDRHFVNFPQESKEPAHVTYFGQIGGTSLEAEIIYDRRKKKALAMSLVPAGETDVERDARWKSMHEEAARNGG